MTIADNLEATHSAALRTSAVVNIAGQRFAPEQARIHGLGLWMISMMREGEQKGEPPSLSPWRLIGDDGRVLATV